MGDRDDDDSNAATDAAAQASESQEQRALRALESIHSGGDLSAEALALSNEFTDRQTARIGAWWRRLTRRIG